MSKAPLSWDEVVSGGAPLPAAASDGRPIAGPVHKRNRAAAAGPGRALLAFRLANEAYAVDILRVREIIKVGPSTEVPRAPVFVSGIISVRGTIVSVIDLRMRLRLAAAPLTKSARILIVEKEGDPYGLIVDEVCQVERLTSSEVEPMPAVIGSAEAQFLAGICRPQGRLLTLLNLDALLAFEVHP